MTKGELISKITKGVEEGNLTDEEAQTHFRKAAKFGLLEMLQLLVKEKGKALFLEQQNIRINALHFTTYSSSIECTEYLINLGFDKNNLTLRTFNNLLATALLQKSCTIEYIKYLISIGIDLQPKSPQSSPLIYPLLQKNHSFELFSYLLSAGMNIPMEEKSNVFLYATRYSTSLQIIKYFVNEGANIHERNSDGANAFLLACTRGSLEILQYLVSLGVDYHCVDNSGANAFFYYLDSDQWKDRSVDILNYFEELKIDRYCCKTILTDNDSEKRNIILCMLEHNIINPQLIRFMIDLYSKNCPEIVHKPLHLPDIERNSIFFRIKNHSRMRNLQMMMKLPLRFELNEKLKSRPLKYVKSIDIMRDIIEKKLDIFDQVIYWYYIITLPEIATDEEQQQTIEILEYMQSKGVDLHFCGSLSALHYICNIANIDYIKFFIKKGANLLHSAPIGSVLHSLFCERTINNNDRLHACGREILVRSLEFFPSPSFDCNHEENDRGLQWKKIFYECVIDPIPPILKMKNHRGQFITLSSPTSFFSCSPPTFFDNLQ